RDDPARVGRLRRPTDEALRAARRPPRAASQDGRATRDDGHRVPAITERINMAIKGWVVHKVNRLFTRVDLPPRATPLGQAVMRHKGEKREPELRTTAGHDMLPRPQHLGAYAPLVAAMREELEQFIAGHVRRHLAIAEHDRY